jgi:hypothetical protein
VCENPTTLGNNVVEVKPVRWKKQINGNYQVRKKTPTSNQPDKQIS